MSRKTKQAAEDSSSRIWAAGSRYALYCTDYKLMRTAMKLKGMPKFGTDDLIVYTDSNGHSVAWQIFFPRALEPAVRELIGKFVKKNEQSR